MSSPDGHPATDTETAALEYNLRPRSIINRLETERRRSSKREPKPKQKPPPLSKYRRRTANARERDRMNEINAAFEALRKAVPHFPQCENSKLTKITTLRLAMNYIHALSQILHNENNDRGSSAGSSAASDGDSGFDLNSFHLLLESDGESLQLSDET
uniref:BHLH domain-containing protein n=1 Tax=Strigamia maritima TaxID=126957 RepID=T1IUM0_STRMM